MKTLNQAQFDTLLERRVNQIAQLLQDIANTTDNNPALMDVERFEKMGGFLGGHVENSMKIVEAAMARPQPMDLGTFSLGAAPAKRGRKKKIVEALSSETAPPPPKQMTAEVPKVTAVIEGRKEPVVDDLDALDIEALLEDEAA